MPKSARQAKPRPGKAGRRRRRRRAALARWAVKWTLTLAIWALVLFASATAWYAADLPDIDEALKATRPPTITVLAADGSRLARSGAIYGAPVRLADVPPALVHAVLATEDRRFYGHFGLDLVGLARAALANVRAGAIVQGGSTITQQVAKNLFLSPRRTLKRKIQEMLLALWLEQRFAKDQILTVYLNRVYFGAGTWGVEAAARRYFGVPAHRLTLYQSALLGGLLKAPSRDSPAHHPRRAARRAAQVLANMVDAGYISAASAAAARRAGAAIVAAPRRRARHFVDWVLEQVPSFAAAGGGELSVLTTLAPRLQGAAEQAVGAVLSGPGAAAGASEAALVAIAHDGAVRAMVGGRDYARSRFNRATQALRQPGSAFKPFVFVAGLEAGLTPETRIDDAPITVDGWTPRNFARRHLGPVSLSTALARSINTVAVKVAERAGRERVVGAARRLGITSKLEPTPSLALGSAEVRLIEMTAAYGAFANGGIGVWAWGIEEIRGAGGRLVYRRAGSGPGRVLDAPVAAAIDAMLAEAVATGSGRAARLARPVAGKTGTSQGFRDAWFIGYSGRLVAGVWMGNDDGTPMQGVTGGGLPARLWRRFMAVAMGGRVSEVGQE